MGCDSGSPPSTNSRAKFLIFGDSITQNAFASGQWVQLLAERYSRRADILNRGYSGYNTRWCSLVLDRLPSENAALCVVFLGANDAAVPASHRQHVPVGEYEENLKDIVRKIRAAWGQPSIVIVTPPAVDEEQHLAALRLRNPAAKVPERTDQSVRAYAAAVRRVASVSDALLVDLYSSMHSQQQKPAHFLSDGLHLNENGGRLLYDLLCGIIAEKLPWLAVEPCKYTGNFHNSGSSSRLRQEFPWHDDLVPQPPYHDFFTKP